jgi:uncharacterized repeat protein (TIGR03806 family)
MLSPRLLLCCLLGSFFPAAAQAQFPAARVAATTLRMPSEGTTLSYKTTPAFGGLFFEQPVQVVFPPSDLQRAFIVERPGRVSLVRDTANPTREVFLDLTGKTETANGGLLSLAFHPRFAENGFFYVWYSTHVGSQRANRLARFHVSPANPAAADATSEVPLITQLTGAGGHDGGMVLFGPDGYLYLAVGDGDQNVPEINAAHQRIDRGFFGGVLRLDVDQKPGSLPPNPHASVHASTYTIPPDNPFVGATSFNGETISPSAARTEFWATGLRNPWRMAFDAADSRLWLADVGLATREEINHITRGANYGWEFREGFVAGPRTGLPAAGVQFTDPIWDYPITQGVSITGGLVYRGTRYADLTGSYVFADFVSGRIWSLVDNGTRPLPATQVRQIGSETGITGITLDPRTGDVLFADFDSNVIKRLVANPNANGTPLPATLADTGAFSNVATLTPAPGVVPYTPNVSFWSDHARKTRWFALPDLASTFGFAATGAWTLPAGAVWVKHFDLELRRGAPATARRVETRVLVKTADGVYGATYRWNDAQTNATLVAEGGGFQSFEVTETNGTTRAQTWLFPSRDQCLTCHTDRGGGALSFNTRQLNRNTSGAVTNQIHDLAALGYLSSPTAPGAATLPALADPADATWPIETRARAYLDANCSQCHQPGGTAVGAFDARASTPLSLAGIVNGRVLSGVAASGDAIIVPGDTAHSMLLRRMTGSGVTRMPPVGSNERDLDGESLIAAWIADLAKPKTASRLLNLAARAHVGTGADVLIPGFVIAGAPRAVLVRAIGPTLAQFGVSDSLSAPVLTLYDSESKPIASNTGWTTAGNLEALQGATARLGAFALADNSADSALFVTLNPGAYTAQTSGANNTAGVALVEIYEDGTGFRPGSIPPGGRLVNAAVRAQVGTGANVLIPGLVVSEGAAKTVLIRAVGPGLTPFGVSGVLSRPVVALFAGSESFVTNSGWNSAANAAEIRATAARVGAFALAENSRDSAILVSLSPGPYTVQVSGANNTSGVALVEVYEVP